MQTQRLFKLILKWPFIYLFICFWYKTIATLEQLLWSWLNSNFSPHLWQRDSSSAQFSCSPWMCLYGRIIYFRRIYTGVLFLTLSWSTAWLIYLSVPFFFPHLFSFKPYICIVWNSILLCINTTSGAIISHIYCYYAGKDKSFCYYSQIPSDMKRPSLTP